MRKPLWQRVHDYFLPHARNAYRPHFFRWVSVVAFVATVLVIEGGYLTQVKVVFPTTNFLSAVLPGVLATLTNEARASSDVPAVTRDPLLDKAATLAATDMATKGYFAHVSPDGKSPWYWLDQVHYAYSYAGENLAVNFSDSEALQTAWLNSPTHRANIMKPEYTRVGFGTASGVYEGKQTIFVVEFFATPPPPPTPVVARVPVAVSSKPQMSTSTGVVLGTETGVPAVTESSPSNATVLPAPRAPEALVSRALVSPGTTTAALLSALFALVAGLILLAAARHVRVPHRTVLVSGSLLLVLMFGILAINPLLVGSVQFPKGDSLSASAITAGAGFGAKQSAE